MLPNTYKHHYSEVKKLSNSEAELEKKVAFEKSVHIELNRATIDKKFT